MYLLPLFTLVLTNYKLPVANSHAALFTKSERFNALTSESLTLTSYRDSYDSNRISEKNSSKSLVELDEELSRCGSNNIDIREITVSQIQEHFKSGELLSIGLTICYLRRISKMNPRLRAVIEVNPDAVRIALRSDYERAMGIQRGSLHGIPILIKDNIATADEMQTTAGSTALIDLKPKRDAGVVKKLRAGGAVILGKTNLSEFAFFRGTNVPDGWSSRGGQTVCPYLASADPNGSSSGSAVAVAANLATLALGTETDGSIASPASRQSIVGLKPTRSRVSNSGVIPLAYSQDVVGPMTRTVADATILLQVIADKGSTLGKCGLSIKNCLKAKSFRIGVIRDPYWSVSNPIFRKQVGKLEAALRALKRTKLVTLVDPVKPMVGSFEKVSPDSVFLHEFKEGINKYLSDKILKNPQTSKNSISSLSGIINFNTEHPSPKGYNQQVLFASEATDGVQNSTYKRLRDENRNGSREFLNYLFETYDLDAVVGPNEEDLNAPLIFSMAAVSGYPSITVPAGFTDKGVPFGISFVGRAFAEGTLLKIAWLLEEAHMGRKPPTFKGNYT